MAIRNRFKFETLHRVRLLQEKVKMRELGKLMSEQMETINYRQCLMDENYRMAGRLSKVNQDSHSVRLAQVTWTRMEFLQDQIEKAGVLIEEVNALIDLKRDEVADAYRSRKMFDKLLEKHNQNVLVRDRRKEEKKLGEGTLIRYFRDAGKGQKT